MTLRIEHRQQPLDQRTVERFRKAGFERSGGTGLRQKQLPFPGIGLSQIGRPGSKCSAKLGLKRVSLCVNPVAVDDEAVRLASLEHRAEHLSRLQPALDSAGIDEQCEPLAVRRPELLFQLEERSVHRLVSFQIDQPEMLGTPPRLIGAEK